MVNLRRQHQGFAPDRLQALRRLQFKQRQRIPALSAVRRASLPPSDRQISESDNAPALATASA